MVSPRSPFGYEPNTTTSSGGRPSLCTPANLERMFQVIRTRGLSDRVAAAAAGIHRSTLSRWKTTCPSLAVKLQSSREDFSEARLNEILSASSPTAKRPAWRAAAWLLERVFPEDYARRRPHQPTEFEPALAPYGLLTAEAISAELEQSDDQHLRQEARYSDAASQMLENHPLSKESGLPSPPPPATSAVPQEAMPTEEVTAHPAVNNPAAQPRAELLQTPEPPTVPIPETPDTHTSEPPSLLLQNYPVEPPPRSAPELTSNNSPSTPVEQPTPDLASLLLQNPTSPEARPRHKSARQICAERIAARREERRANRPPRPKYPPIPIPPHLAHYSGWLPPCPNLHLLVETPPSHKQHQYEYPPDYQA